MNRLDVENLLLADSIPTVTVERVMRRVERRQLSARTMWRWADVHGTDKVVLVIDAAVAEDTLLDHLDAGTAPDWRTLGVLAGLNNDTMPAGMPLAELIDLDEVPSMADLTFPTDLADWSTTVEPQDLRRFGSLPPIAAPGLAAFSPIADWDADGWDWDRDDHWPAAA